MAKFPYAGDLRHSITLQTRSRSTDTGGGFTSSWGNTRVLFAKITPISGNNPYSNGRIEHDLTHDIYTRYYSDINYSSGGGAMRISWSDSGVARTFGIKYVITINERDRFLLFRCSEGGPDDD
jgi:SPP1 family predicted phage head-tail adaptor